MAEPIRVAYGTFDTTANFAADQRDLGHTPNVNDYERAAEDLADAIRLGYETEQADPNFQGPV